MPTGLGFRRASVIGFAALLVCLALEPSTFAVEAQHRPSARGDKVWLKRYRGRENSDNLARAMATSTDGTKVFVTGDSRPGDHVATIAYSAATGGTLWAARYNTFTEARAMAVSPDGSKVFVSGDIAEGSVDYLTIAYDSSTGAKLWVARYRSPPGPGFPDDFPAAIVVSPDGSRVFVTGAAGDVTLEEMDYATVAYDSATGAQLWAKRYNGPGGGPGDSWDNADALGVSPDGTMVFVSGESIGLGDNEDWATVAYEASTGSKLWVARYNGPGNSDDLARSLGVSPDGTRVFVTGSSQGSMGNDSTTIAYDSTTGATEWLARYRGPVTDSSSDTAALGVSPDGKQVLVTGEAFQGVAGDYLTMAYDASSGATRWVNLYQGPGPYNAAAFLGVSPDGAEVFVTGQSSGLSTGHDYATIAYDASTGGEQWVSRYNGPGNGDDVPAGLGVNRDGTRVFVTGYGLGSTGHYDYATIAYSAS